MTFTSVDAASWLSTWADGCTGGYACPFERVTVRLWWQAGEEHRRGVIQIVGIGQEGERSTRVSLTRLRDIARDHLRSRHYITDSLCEVNIDLCSHAVAIAAVACLMD